MNYVKSFQDKQARILNSYNTPKAFIEKSETKVDLEKGGQGSGHYDHHKGSAAFGMYAKHSDQELADKHKQLKDLKGKQNPSEEEQHLIDHEADLHSEIKKRASKLQKGEPTLFDQNKSRVLSIYGQELFSWTPILEDILKSQDDVEFKLSAEPKINIDDLNKSEIQQNVKDYMLQKAFDILDSPDYLEKGVGRAGLHPEKVTVKTKDGGSYQAIRWVHTESGKANKLNGFKHEDEHEGATTTDKIDNIVTGSQSNKDKVRNLIGMGIYDRKHLGNLVDDGYARQFTKQADLNQNDFNNVELDDEGNVKSAEATLTSNDPNAGKKYRPEIDMSMSMEEAQEALSAKDFALYRKKQIEALRSEFGISADKMWLSYERNISRLVQIGQPKSMLAYGTGGVGKTYTLEQVLAREKVRMYQTGLDMQPEDYDALKITGSTSKTGLWRKLYENRDKMIIFDDCDSLWDDSDCVNWLKGALDSSGDGTINYDSGDRVKLTPGRGNTGEDGEEGGERAPTEFQFTGKIIFISNLTSAQLVAKGAGPLVESRTTAIDLTMDKNQTMDKLGKIKDHVIIRDNKGNAIPGVTQEDRDMAFAFLEQMKDKLPVTKINGRSLGNLIGTAWNLRRIGQMTPENFTDEALITMLS